MSRVIEFYSAARNGEKTSLSERATRKSEKRKSETVAVVASGEGAHPEGEGRVREDGGALDGGPLRGPLAQLFTFL